MFRLAGRRVQRRVVTGSIDPEIDARYHIHSLFSCGPSWGCDSSQLCFGVDSLVPPGRGSIGGVFGDYIGVSMKPCQTNEDAHWSTKREWLNVSFCISRLLRHIPPGIHPRIQRSCKMSIFAQAEADGLLTMFIQKSAPHPVRCQFPNITKSCPATRWNLETHPFWRICLSADYKDGRKLWLGTYTPNGGIKMEMKYSKTSLFAVFISENILREAKHL